MQQLSFDDIASSDEIENEERKKQFGFDPEVLGRKEGRWQRANRPQECQTREQHSSLGRHLLGESGFKDDPDGKKLELWMKGWKSAWE